MTDNNPLTYVTTTAKLDATGQRWMAALANYNFKIRYRAGKLNADADGLSRIPDQAKQNEHGQTVMEAIATAVAADIEKTPYIFSVVTPESVTPCRRSTIGCS